MKKLFIDLDGTIAKFNVRNALERFDKEEGFFANLKAYKGIEKVNEFAAMGLVYVISASPNEIADRDKNIWLKKFLPNINEDHVTFCRLGENKAKIIENKYNIKIDSNCLLLDDYTKNLNEWESIGGVGVKRLTSIADNSTKKWQGLTLKDLNKLDKLFI